MEGGVADADPGVIICGCGRMEMVRLSCGYAVRMNAFRLVQCTCSERMRELSATGRC